jgi:PleD family two-component response regulator
MPSKKGIKNVPCCKLLIANDVHTNEEILANQDTKRRILAVDDQPDITIALKIGLEENGGFDVNAFTDPEQALSRFKPELYDSPY